MTSWDETSSRKSVDALKVEIHLLVVAKGGVRDFTITRRHHRLGTVAEISQSWIPS